MSDSSSYSLIIWDSHTQMSISFAVLWLCLWIPGLSLLFICIELWKLNFLTQMHLKKIDTTHSYPLPGESSIFCLKNALKKSLLWVYSVCVWPHSFIHLIRHSFRSFHSAGKTEKMLALFGFGKWQSSVCARCPSLSLLLSVFSCKLQLVLTYAAMFQHFSAASSSQSFPLDLQRHFPAAFVALFPVAQYLSCALAQLSQWKCNFSASERPAFPAV